MAPNPSLNSSVRRLLDSTSAIKHIEGDMSLMDVVTNVFSDFVLIFLIAIFLWLASLSFHYGRLGKAHRFFGFHAQVPLRIYVSGFEHPGVKTKRVVNAIEYETAVEMRNTLKRLPGSGFVRKLMDFLAGLIGQDIRLPESDIDISPLADVSEAPYPGSMILIGGPVSNQVRRFYLSQGTPQFRFDQATEKYQERGENGYQPIQSSGDVAVLEKRIFGEQVVILAHGFGEDQTRRAVQHLISNWEELQKRHGNGEFGIRV